MSEDVGYIKVWRQIRQHRFWLQRRRFSDLEAWLDLLMLSNFKPSKIRRGATWRKVRRGQVFTSQVSLAKRWRWDRKTVSRFLQALKEDTMVDIETDSGGDSGYTIVSICNYEKFQGRDHDALDSGGDSERDNERPNGAPAEGQRRPTSEEDRRSLRRQKKGRRRADARTPSPSSSGHRPSRKSVDADWNRPPWTEEDFR